MPHVRDRRSAPLPRERTPGRGEEIAERRARALEEPLDIRRLPGVFVRLEVRNPIHGTHYTVLLPTYPSRDVSMCTCTDFSRSGLGTCKHVEAAFRWMATHPDELPDPKPSLADSSPSWQEIDRRIRSVPSDASPARRMAWAGSLLSEKGPSEKREKEGVGHRAARASKA